ncbi:hypothetical protein [Xanthobacter autotrophicus]|uniref:hypothetical protein n=1 Tax=Xanthobacter autotrophicus TaxID=280 RepID=UPI00372C4792
MTILTRLCVADGSWEVFEADWSRQCAEFDETLDSFAPAHVPMLKAAATKEPKSGAFALPFDDHHAAACQLNCTPLPGYDGPVLRLRFLTLSPRYDLGNTERETYREILVRLLQGVLDVSDTLWPARHVKFHLASPADKDFFEEVGKPLDASGVFENVGVKGSWLYISKSKL